jgi:large subunit ribosomal protein L6
MSKIGKKSVVLNGKVTVKQVASVITLCGPMGSLSIDIPDLIVCKINSSKIDVKPKTTNPANNALWGMFRSLLNNMAIGVNIGFVKKLSVIGIGYKANINSGILTLSLGYSHDIGYVIPNDIKVTCDNNMITVSGIDKQRVGQVSAEIRSLRTPDPYKGKGIIYTNEVIVRKEGKKR